MGSQCRLQSCEIGFSLDDYERSFMTVAKRCPFPSHSRKQDKNFGYSRATIPSARGQVMDPRVFKCKFLQQHAMSSYSELILGGAVTTPKKSCQTNHPDDPAYSADNVV